MKFKFINITDSKTKELPLPEGKFLTTGSAEVNYSLIGKTLRLNIGPDINHMTIECIDDLINFLATAKRKMNEN